MAKMKCANCGIEKLSPPSHVKRVNYNYCSRKCRDEHQRGKNHPGYGKTRSAATRAKISKTLMGHPSNYANTPKTGETRNCEVCGGEFYAQQSWIKSFPAAYCSVVCWHKTRRKVIPDLPDIRDTLAGDCCTCLICGKSTNSKGKPLQLLSGHIRMVHNMRADEYREMFGFSRKTGLASESFRKRARERFLKAPPWSLDGNAELLREAVKAGKLFGVKRRYEAILRQSDNFYKGKGRKGYRFTNEKIPEALRK